MFDVKNIKASLKIQPILLSTVVEFLLEKNISVKSSNNFVIFHNVFTFVIFKTNSKEVNHINITKVKSWKDLDESVEHLKNLLNPLVCVKRLNVDNITATHNFKRSLNLKSIADRLNRDEVKISFNKEKFPGMFIHFSKGTVILFNSGKSVCVGCNNNSLLEKNFDFVNNCIQDNS